jgi:tetratricopeptide (TPR) repeat protein
MKDFGKSDSVERLLDLIRAGVKEPTRGAILWVGAGLSIPAEYPSWRGLAERLREKSTHKLPADPDPFRTIDAFVRENGRGLLLQVLSDVFETRHPPLPYHFDLMRLPWWAVITTNYDELLEDGLKKIGKPYRLKILDENLDINPGPDTPLYKIHGSVEDFKKTILDSRAYETYFGRYPVLVGDLESMLRKHSIVFFGCGMTDPRLVDWLEKLGPEGRDLILPSATVMIRKDWNAIPKRIRDMLGEAHIEPVILDDYAEIPELIAYLRREICLLPESGNLVFHISFAKKSRQKWVIKSPSGERTVEAPWIKDRLFGLALRDFMKLSGGPVGDQKERQELQASAGRLGQALAETLLNKTDLEQLKSCSAPGSAPLLTIESDDNLILALPWELLWVDGEFAVREAKLDLARSVSGDGKKGAPLPPPDRYMSLLVTVSAPHGSHLDYEAESYRIVKALHDYGEIHYTDLGTVKDLLDGLAEHKPMGIHFSGHGGPGTLLFEDDEGMPKEIEVREFLRELRSCISDPESFPRFLYLASCHGNTPPEVDKDEAGSYSSAAQLHREGIAEVVGYFGPIHDELSTRAEVALYRAIAEGLPTRIGIRQARLALSERLTPHDPHCNRETAPPSGSGGSYPFAWAQLVFYHRGPEHPLSLKLPGDYAREREESLQREFREAAGRKILSAGFIGRRKELHEFRRRLRGGQKVFVFQGLGGIGKTALATQRVLQIARKEKPVFGIWCAEMRDEKNLAGALVRAVSDFGRNLIGHKWMQVVDFADRTPDATEPQRLAVFLDAILKLCPDLTVYLDNMETRLKGPDNKDPKAFGEWRSAELEAIWMILEENAKNGLFVLASCRYRNRSFRRVLIPLSPMGDSALFRMMGWFPTLRRLSTRTRARLVEKLQGHPRAVELLEGRLDEAMREWEDKKGRWTTPTTDAEIEREWKELVEPALPEVERKLDEDLLLDEIWKNVLDDRCRRILFRMSLLRRPWDWNLMMGLGDRDGTPSSIKEDVQRLRNSSLLMEAEEREVEAKWVKLFFLHSTTIQFARRRMAGQETELEKETYVRIGTYLEELAKKSRDVQDDLDAGEYLFRAGEFDRASHTLAAASETLQGWGHVREGLDRLEPFLDEEVSARLSPKMRGDVFGTVGSAYHRLGQTEKALEYYEKALEIDRDIGERRGEGADLGSLGLAYADLGQVEKAIEYHEKALEISREIGDRQGEGNDLGNLGIAYQRLGRVEKAIGYYEKALEISREIGDRRQEGNALGNLGLACADLGQVERAIEYHEKALEISREIGDRQGEGNDLGNLGNAYHRLGEVQKAIGYYEKALAIAREIGDRRGEGNHLGNLGNAYYRLGQLEKAIEHYERALDIAREMADGRGEGHALGSLGLAYARLGKLERANEYLNQALTIAREIKDPYIEGIVTGALKELAGKKAKRTKP